MGVILLRISFSIKLEDVWIGLYYDGEKKIIYFCPLPCCCFKIELGKQIQKKDLCKFCEYWNHLFDVDGWGVCAAGGSQQNLIRTHARYSCKGKLKGTG